MQQNLFHPVYIRLEQEFKELRYRLLSKRRLKIIKQSVRLLPGLIGFAIDKR